MALRLEPGPTGTRIRRLSGCGPVYLQKPFYPEGEVAHLYLLHPPGGFVGGDRLEIDLTVAQGAAGLVTTPAAGKFYRSTGASAEVMQRLTVAAGGALEWLPQESLYFSGTRARVATEVRVADQARFIGWDIATLGRPASGDRFETGSAASRFAVSTVRPAGGTQLRLVEQNRWTAGAPLLTASWGLRGLPVSGTLIALPADRDVLERVRASVPPARHQPELQGAMTLIEDMLVARVLAAHNESARHWLGLVWQALRPLVLGRAPCVPRIWHT